MTGYHIGFEIFAQSLGQRHRVQEHGRLGDLRLAQLFVRAVEHHLADGKSEDLVRAVEEGFDGGRFFVQVGAHSGKLGSLTGENVCFHLYYDLILKFLSSPGSGRRPDPVRGQR